jgi:hypothetical protein
MKYILLFVVTIFSSLSFAGLSPDYKESVLESAKKAMGEHLMEENLSLKDATLQLGYKESEKKSTFFFLVEEHKGESEIYKVECFDERCRLDYH